MWIIFRGKNVSGDSMRKLPLAESHRKFWERDSALRYESEKLIYLHIASEMAWKGKESGDELIN